MHKSLVDRKGEKQRTSNVFELRFEQLARRLQQRTGVFRRQPKGTLQGFLLPQVSIPQVVQG